LLPLEAMDLSTAYYSLFYNYSFVTHSEKIDHSDHFSENELWVHVYLEGTSIFRGDTLRGYSH